MKILQANPPHPSAKLQGLLDVLRRTTTVISPGSEQISPAMGGARAVPSFAQGRLLFLDQFTPGSPLYNVPVAVRLLGRLRGDVLRRTLAEVVRRHEVLRTRFVAGDDGALAEVVPAGPVELPVIDLTCVAASQVVERLLAAESQRPFDLSQCPLFRARLLYLGPAEHVLFFNLHHITCDGWSIAVLFREVALIYDAFSGDRPSPLSDLPIQYADFAVWQRARLQGETLDRLLAYWRRQLAGAPESLGLPVDKPESTIRSDAAGTLPFNLSAPLVDALRQLKQGHGATLFMKLLACFQILLSRHTGQTDIMVGTPVANRTQPEIERLIGLFVNTLAIRSDLSGNPPFSELLARVRETALDAWSHQELPFEKLVQELRIHRDIRHEPLFQTMFVLQNTPRNPEGFRDLEVEWLEADNGRAKFDLLLSASETASGITGTLRYRAELYDRTTMERMLEHWKTLLEGVAADAGRRIGELPLLSEAEREQVVVGWNRTEREYGGAGTVHGLVEAQVRRSPEAVAVIGEGERLSYG